MVMAASIPFEIDISFSSSPLSQQCQQLQPLQSSYSLTHSLFPSVGLALSNSFTSNLPSVGLALSNSFTSNLHKHTHIATDKVRHSHTLEKSSEASSRPLNVGSLTQSETNARDFLHSSFTVEERSVSLETLRRVAAIEENACDSTSEPSTPQRSITVEISVSREQSLADISSIQKRLGGSDSFMELHQLLDKEDEIRVSFGRGTFDKEETASLMEKLTKLRSRSLELIKTEGKISVNQFSRAVDPETLIPGEYVVHKTKGIGRFVRFNYEVQQGMNKPTEYVILQYADGLAKLKTKQAARLLYRYFQSGEKGKAPPLSKLNDPRQWEKRKTKTRLAAQKMVVDLLQLYVGRLKQKRSPYSRNDEGMAKFVAKFQFKPTPDQEQAFADVERDMVERDTPMDRLICGDVGFGKTEVALRAIFRVISAGKQVMVLAPTTVLAKQHYNVINERFSTYKVRVAILSRFQTAAEKRNMAIQIREGNLDIIVGTHALLAKTINYSNLGLLVVDEEQRFGVKQKERIASFKTSVDVLTLSATPIPRTLQLALTGFRDASLIATPPPERVPIITHLSEYNEEKMKSAIEFELARRGQVYYVLPRIQGIGSKKVTLEALFPGVNIGVAHGRQSANYLEETMDSFAEGESEILLCTNIIESGLDIRRVNTIIVEDVQQFGLAQIYQLRGRVGRADKEAHAYLFYPKKDVLSDEALERLVALEECCGPGQGFKLAERDMAIRGFGSIFGEKQSGEVAHIGKDLFMEMVLEILSKAGHPVFFQYDYNEVKLNLDLSYHIPRDYIPDSHRRECVLSELEVAASSGMRELMHFTNNLRREFGREPPSVEVLVKGTYVRRVAADLGIHDIWVRHKTVLMNTNMSETFFEILKEGMTSEPLQSSLTFQNGVIELILLVELSPERVLERIFACLVDLRRGLSSFAKQGHQ